MNLNIQLRSFFLVSLAVGACTASLCKDGEVRMGEESSIWKKRNSHPSCIDIRGVPFKSEGVSACKGDHTSISLDMGNVRDKQGCWIYSTQDTQGWTWDFQKGSVITFDAEWSGCEKLWSAPLWLTPNNWRSPQWSTGEIDLLEKCGAGHETFRTSIICNQHSRKEGDGECIDPQWGQVNGGSGHFHGKIDAAGTWIMEKCDLDKSNCKIVSRYPRYLELNRGTLERAKFHFVSDLFNGGDGDEGWKGCVGDRGTINTTTKCKYTIANIVYAVGPADPADPSPDPSPSGECNGWCAGDTKNRNEGRHCGGDMDSLCGGCSYCHSGVCNDWCAIDNKNRSEGRHCGGDMDYLCGGCSYCNSARSEL